MDHDIYTTTAPTIELLPPTPLLLLLTDLPNISKAFSHGQINEEPVERVWLTGAFLLSNGIKVFDANCYLSIGIKGIVNLGEEGRESSEEDVRVQIPPSPVLSHSILLT